MAVVFDTNVLVSAALFAESVPSSAVRWAATHDIILASAATLAELTTTIERTKFDRYVSRATRREFVASIYDTVEPVAIRRAIRICRDPDDDKFLEVAINGGARFLVTGDADLLDLRVFEQVTIVPPGDYLASVSSPA